MKEIIIICMKNIIYVYENNDKLLNLIIFLYYTFFI